MLAGLILDALFPDACLACLAPREPGQRHDLACDDCLRGVVLPGSFSCASCDAPAAVRPVCHPDAPSSLVLGAPGSRVVGSLADALLYEGMERAAAPLAELLAGAAINAGLPLHRSFAAPVPTLPAELRERGYDANLALASGCARMLGMPLAPHLLCVTRRSGMNAYGIGDPGEAASGDRVILVGAQVPGEAALHRCARLIRAACPHATPLVFACSG